MNPLAFKIMYYFNIVLICTIFEGPEDHFNYQAPLRNSSRCLQSVAALNNTNYYAVTIKIHSQIFLTKKKHMRKIVDSDRRTVLSWYFQCLSHIGISTNARDMHMYPRLTLFQISIILLSFHLFSLTSIRLKFQTNKYLSWAYFTTSYL